jgi:hypothetical protein
MRYRSLFQRRYHLTIPSAGDIVDSGKSAEGEWSAGSGREPRTVAADAMARAGRYLDYAGGMFDRVTAGLAIEPAEVLR